MSGFTSFLAEIALPPLRDGLALGGPVLFLAALAWLVTRTETIMERVFPDLEWERNLGWLNIRAERRADRAIRWLGYGVTILLIDSLAGIFWAAKGVHLLANWSDPWMIGEVMLRMSAGVLCLSIWMIYLGLGLLPRLRAEREAASLRKFRAEVKARDEEKGGLEIMGEVSRRTPFYVPAPRTLTKTVTLTPRRHWREHPPGG